MSAGVPVSSLRDSAPAASHGPAEEVTINQTVVVLQVTSNLRSVVIVL